ncbi:exopolysaccharide biosynthesis polyprenyl glycosylphosphotransferase [Actinomadura kijaniata]|uniref:exopolysaccharide biosynthesis polyprenyl glycosylphosphotransferase n=1 Tax=Actinomadura kijaniata TaxID=46161 RepID=UPI003F1AA4EB
MAGADHADDLPPARARRVRAALVAGHAAGGAGTDAAAAFAASWLLTRSLAHAGLTASAVVGVQTLTGRYRARRALSLVDTAVPLVRRLCALVVFGALLTGAPLASTSQAPVAFLSLGVCAVVAVSGHALLAGLARAYRRRRTHQRRALLVGGGNATAHVAGTLLEHPEFGMIPIGQLVFTSTPPDPVPGCPPVPVLGDGTRCVPLAEAAAADVLVLVADDIPRHRTPDVLAAASRGSAETLLFPSLGTPMPPGDGLDHLAGLPCLPLNTLHRARHARRAKRAFDLLAALLLLAVAWPVMAVCAVAVRIEGGPGVLFRQRRLGAGGREFVLLKFRTLQPDSAHESDTRWSVEGDVRMGPVGRFLRGTSLDELPQLWNVIRGDMSLVGPRPERPYFVERFSAAHPGYGLRHRVPVGVTGWAQIHGLRGDTSIEQRARFDNHYIENWSFARDLKVLVWTALAMCGRQR